MFQPHLQIILLYKFLIVASPGFINVMRKYISITLVLLCSPMFSMGQDTLSLSITGRDAKCNGSTNGSAKAKPSGGVAPYSYIWAPAIGTSDSVGGLAAGIYSVTVRDSIGDSVSGSITIHQPAPLTVWIDSIVVYPCLRTTDGGVCGCANTLWAVVSGGTPPYSYLWTPGSSSSTASVTSDTLGNACYLEFTVQVTDSNHCITYDSLNVVSPVIHAAAAMGVGQISNTNGISVYPNPANNLLNIGIGPSVTDARSVEVYNVIGEKIFERKLGGSEPLITIDASGFANGNYLLRLLRDGSQLTTHFSISR